MAAAVPLPLLLDGLAEVRRARRVSVTGVENYSRRVRAGDLYLALQGTRAHGLDFLPEVIERGARAVAWEGARAAADGGGVPMVHVEGLRAKAGVIAARFFAHPSRELSVVAVTGTDGKTSVSHFVAEALSLAGRRCGLFGTLGGGEFGDLAPSANTTPDALELHRGMRRLRDDGVRDVVLEASSHGIVQGRLNGLAINVAVLTNVGSDHGDYHATRADYAAAKRRLFQTRDLEYAVVNADDEHAGSFIAACAPRTRVITYSSAAAADVRAERAAVSVAGLEIAARAHGEALALSAPLLGRFNVANLLAALAALIAVGVAAGDAAALLSRVRPVRGRMQRFGGGDKPLVVLDYAHTPQALAQALACCRELASRRVACVFGCGGERDADKRPRMGEIAARLCDCAFITDDNPRAEDADAIVADVMSGVGDRANVEIIRDRARAIGSAVAACAAGDVVLVAGKGHETCQIVAGRTLPFDDAEVIRRALAGAGERT